MTSLCRERHFYSVRTSFNDRAIRRGKYGIVVCGSSVNEFHLVKKYAENLYSERDVPDFATFLLFRIFLTESIKRNYS